MEPNYPARSHPSSFVRTSFSSSVEQVPSQHGRAPSQQGRSSSQQDRPSSALTRGVQIIEFKETRVNPEPIVLDESEILMEEYLAPRKLVRICADDVVRTTE